MTRVEQLASAIAALEWQLADVTRRIRALIRGRYTCRPRRA